MIEPEAEWWTRSLPTPDLKPSLSSELGSVLELESRLAGVRIRFPWWDSRSDVQPFLNWLRSAPDGGAFSDLDQGWVIDALRRGNQFHLLDRDWENAKVLANVVVARDRFLQALDEAEGAAER
jgi:hypothetical protein